jgi:hypothetical protein
MLRMMTRAQQPQHVRAVAEAIGEEVGDRDRVVPVGPRLERPCHEHPRERDAEHLAEHHPEGMDADGVAHPGQPEQQPRAFAGRVGAERDDPGRQLLAGDIVALDVARAAAAPDADGQQHQQVDGDDGDDRRGRRHRVRPAARTMGAEEGDLDRQSGADRGEDEGPGGQRESGEHGRDYITCTGGVS